LAAPAPCAAGSADVACIGPTAATCPDAHPVRRPLCSFWSTTLALALALLPGAGMVSAAPVGTGTEAAPGAGAPPNPPDAAGHGAATAPAAPSLQFVPGPFADLAPGYWALPLILDLAQAGLALAPAPDRFDPYAPETRGAWLEQVVLTILPSPPPAPAAAPFPDVPAGAPAAAEVAAAQQRGWIDFPTDGGLHPDAPITRQEAFAVLGLALFGQSGVGAAAASGLPFADAAEVAPWAYGPVAELYQAGYLAGIGDGRLAPLAPLSRADAAVLLDTVLRHLLTVDGHRYRVLSVRTMRATAYGSGEGVGGYTATGTPCRLGEAAANPAVLPFGTLLFVTGYDGHGYLPPGGLLERIEDTGHLGPDDLDLYIPGSGPEPYRLFGVQRVTAYVLDPRPVA
jgi:3D (Asp-Asp-Asp) domain-containing protein